MVRQFTTRHNFNYTKALTEGLGGWVLNLAASKRSPEFRREFYDHVIATLTDTEPDRGLEITAQDPVPPFYREVVGFPVTPLERWHQLERDAVALPPQVQPHARTLGIGDGKLPSWRQIAAFFEGLGFEAVPMRGYVGEPVYSYLLATNRIPFCTQWGLRYVKANTMFVPADGFHDIGHGFALAMPVYRDLHKRFAETLVSTQRIVSMDRLVEQYFRYFECSYIYTEAAETCLLGSMSMIFENVGVGDDGKLFPLYRDPGSPYQLSPTFKPHVSLAAWAERCERFIEELARVD